MDALSSMAYSVSISNLWSIIYHNIPYDVCMRTLLFCYKNSFCGIVVVLVLVVVVVVVVMLVI